MPEEKPAQDASQELRDRANRHWAAVNAMKEHAEAVGSGDMSLLDANDAKHEILKTLRGLDNTVITDLLAEIVRLKQATHPNQARQKSLEAELREQTAENERLRKALCEANEARDVLRRRVALLAARQEGLQAALFDADAFEQAGRRAIDLLPHYRAVLHDLSRPQPKTPAQLKAEREEDLADKINQLQAGGEALGC